MISFVNLATARVMQNYIVCRTVNFNVNRFHVTSIFTFTKPFTWKKKSLLSWVWRPKTTQNKTEPCSQISRRPRLIKEKVQSTQGEKLNVWPPVVSEKSDNTPLWPAPSDHQRTLEHWETGGRLVRKPEVQPPVPLVFRCRQIMRLFLREIIQRVNKVQKVCTQA